MPHIHEKIDFTSEVFIVYKNKVLLRMHEKYNKWLGVGGHIELDEDPNQAAIREVKEEVGLDITLWGKVDSSNNEENYHELIPPIFLNRHRVSSSHEHVTFVYFAISDTDIIDQDKVKEVIPETKWFTIDELDDPQYGIIGNIKMCAREALRQLAR